VGYNPKKPGRPSHNYHTYLIGSLRVVMGVGVSPGKQHSAQCGMPGLWELVNPKALHHSSPSGEEKTGAQSAPRKAGSRV
jgi:hypothetical protein